MKKYFRILNLLNVCSHNSNNIQNLNLSIIGSQNFKYIFMQHTHNNN